MPAVPGPQGSRGGLITAVAIFTILFVVSTIFAIYYGVENSKIQDEFATYKKQQESVVRNPASPDVADLRADHDFITSGGSSPPLPSFNITLICPDVVTTARSGRPS